MRKKLKTWEKLVKEGWKGSKSHLIKGDWTINDSMLSKAGQYIDVLPNTNRHVTDYQYYDGRYYYTEDMFEHPEVKRNLPDWF